MIDQTRKSVFLLLHESSDEDVKVIGVFSTLEQAQKAGEELSSKGGFRDGIDGFSVDEYEIDKIFWTEGYVSRRLT